MDAFQFIEDVITMDRLRRVYKKIIINFVKAVIHVVAHKIYAPNMFILFIESLFFTAFYFSVTYDFPGSVHLLAAQFICTFMIYKVKYILGTVFIVALLMTWFPPYHEYLETKVIAFGAELFLLKIFVFKAPNFAYIVFHLCMIGSKYFTDFDRGVEDIPMVVVLLKCLICMYEQRYEGGDVLGIGVLMGIWMYSKSRRVPARPTEMRPSYEMFAE